MLIKRLSRPFNYRECVSVALPNLKTRRIKYVENNKKIMKNQHPDKMQEQLQRVIYNGKYKEKTCDEIFIALDKLNAKLLHDLELYPDKYEEIGSKYHKEQQELIDFMTNVLNKEP